MANVFFGLAIVLVVLNLAFLLLLLRRLSELSHSNVEQAVREELRLGREESARSAKDLAVQSGWARDIKRFATKYSGETDHIEIPYSVIRSNYDWVAHFSVAYSLLC